MPGIGCGVRKVPPPERITRARQDCQSSMIASELVPVVSTFKRKRDFATFQHYDFGISKIPRERRHQGNQEKTVRQSPVQTGVSRYAFWLLRVNPESAIRER